MTRSLIGPELINCDGWLHWDYCLLGALISEHAYSVSQTDLLFTGNLISFKDTMIYYEVFIIQTTGSFPFDNNIILSNFKLN